MGAASCASGPAAPPEDHLAVLFIGNSLTYWNDMPAMLARLLDAQGAGPVTVHSSSFPNYGLQDHWEDPRTREALARGGWDVVVLQQGPSATEGRPSLLDFSARFAAEIRAGGATPALYMVWPSAARAFDFDGVSESYQRAAESVDGLLFPAGEAWRAAWRADSALALYGADGFHPSSLGSYLAALVISEQLSGRSAAGLDPGTAALVGVVAPDSASVRILHEAASEANGAFARTGRP